MGSLPFNCSVISFLLISLKFLLPLANFSHTLASQAFFHLKALLSPCISFFATLVHPWSFQSPSIFTNYLHFLYPSPRELSLITLSVGKLFQEDLIEVTSTQFYHPLTSHVIQQSDFKGKCRLPVFFTPSFHRVYVNREKISVP